MSSKRDALKKLKEKNNLTTKSIDEREIPIDEVPVVMETTENSDNQNDVNLIDEKEQVNSAKIHDNEEIKSAVKQEIISNKDTISKKNTAKSKRKLGKQIDISAASTISWTCKIESETYLNFQLLVADQGTNKLELINRIIENEIEWQKNNPEFPERAFVMENLKNKSTTKSEDYISAKELKKML